MVREFDYLLEKLRFSEFVSEPFQHLYIENFFSNEHFHRIIASQQINLLPQHTAQDLIETLLREGWRTQEFPGCTVSTEEYLSCLESNVWPVDTNLLEGFGMAFRANEVRDPMIVRLLAFLNSGEFQEALELKF